MVNKFKRIFMVSVVSVGILAASTLSSYRIAEIPPILPASESTSIAEISPILPTPPSQTVVAEISPILPAPAENTGA
jgi:hypothetical protein